MRKKLAAVLLAATASLGLLASTPQVASAASASGNSRTSAPMAKIGHSAKPASIRTKHFSVSRTVSGVVWVFACDGRWDYVPPSGSGVGPFTMKSTSCNATRNGVDSSVKVDAVRFYYTTSSNPIPDYQFCGALTTYDDCGADDATHTGDAPQVSLSTNAEVLMKVWGLPNAGDAALSDSNVI